MNRIVLTGGGSAGHVTPNLALVPALIAKGYDVVYVGTAKGMEYGLASEAGLQFFSIHSGKLRRYFDFRNLTDLFLLAIGVAESLVILSKVAPVVVFSKGGFVSCPVVWAAWLLRIPVVLHESDITPGLANRLCIPFARKVCYSFPESAAHLPKEKSVLTGVPIRDSILTGSHEKGLQICRFDSRKPVLLVIGGSLGAQKLNSIVRDALLELLGTYQVAHLCGTGNLSPEASQGYWQAEYVTSDLFHILTAADVVVSRAGATTVFELLALRKPALLIPLGRDASRGDQIENAESLRKHGWCNIIAQEGLSIRSFVNAVDATYRDREVLVRAMVESPASNGTAGVLNVIAKVAKKS